MRKRYKLPKPDSVFGLLTEQASHLVSAADMLTKLLASDLSERDDLNSQMHAIEHAADEASHAVFKKVNRTFVTPLDREDLHDLSSLIDDCVDAMDEAGDLMTLYRIEKLPKPTVDQVTLIGRCARLTHEIIPTLGNIDDSLRDYWIEINGLENQGDKAYRKMLGKLMNSERPALEVLKIKGVIDVLEEALDSFEELAVVVESIAIKEA